MTDFDKILLEKAKLISRWRYRELDGLITIADTEEARQHLLRLRSQLRDLAEESL